jgi:iron complex outermembrane recepter protein
LRTAVGLMHKRDAFRYTADPIAAQVLPDGRVDIVGFNARDDIDSDDYNTDVYVELLVPLLADRPGVRLLEAGLGYRHSQYDQAGGADAWKVELLYRPVDSLRLRGSFQNAIRAPSITELFSPQLPELFFLPAGDPCQHTSAARTGPDAAAVEALCIAQGVPAEMMPNFLQPFPFATGFVGGNPELRPEEAETWTVGLVWSPAPTRPHLGRLQAALDWYRIDVDEAIQTVPMQEILALCFNPQANPEFSPDQPWCTFFSRNPDTGEIVDAFAIQRNLGRLSTSGIDLQLDWSLPAGPGSLGVNALVSWLDRFERSAGAGAPTEELAGLVSFLPGTSLPEWKGLLGLSYMWQRTSVSARARYIASMEDTLVPGFNIPSRSYLDLFASHDFGPGWLDGLRLGVGIENATDRDPPVFSSGAAGTDPQQYDVLGRRYFATFNYRF